MHMAPEISAASNSSCALRRPVIASAVETCVPLSSASPSLGPSVSGAKSDLGQRLGRRQLAAGEPDAADADQRRGDMCQRRKIARGADRALAGDHRQGVMGKEMEQGGDGGRLHARAPEAQACRLEQQHQPGGRRVERRAHAAHVREHEAALQLGDVGRRDAHAGELAEAGVDAVDGGLASGSPGHQRRGGGDTIETGRIELQPHCRRVDPAFDDGQSKPAGDENLPIGHRGASRWIAYSKAARRSRHCRD